MLTQVKTIGMNIVLCEMHVIVLLLISIWGKKSLKAFAIEVALAGAFLAELDIALWIGFSSLEIVFVISC
jgi:hypothetical protein